MTKLLDDAIKKAHELPDAERDEATEMLLAAATRPSRPVPLDDDTHSAVREGQEQARGGEFVSDEDMARFFRRHGCPCWRFNAETSG